MWRIFLAYELFQMKNIISQVYQFIWDAPFPVTLGDQLIVP
jgi:hypothetical protein